MKWDIIKLIKMILANDIVYVSEKDRDNFIKSIVGGCASELLMGQKGGVINEKRRSKIRK